MKMQILILSTNETDVHTDWLSKQTTITITGDTETAIEKLHQQLFDAFIFSSSLSSLDKNKVKKIAQLSNDHMLVIQKEKSSTLNTCISSTIDKIKALPKSTIIIKDDVLKNISLNIHLN